MVRAFLKWLVPLSLAGCLAVWCCWDGLSPSVRDHRKEPKVAPASGAALEFVPERIEAPAVENPSLEYAEDVPLDDEAMVIGIVVNGEARAYVRDALGMEPRRHVVTDSFDSTPVAITHCDRINCTRVFAGPELAMSGTIRVGGWREDQTLELIVNEQQYSQKSSQIPLADVPFLELPWGMWRELFPDTLVYVGKS